MSEGCLQTATGWVVPAGIQGEIRGRLLVGLVALALLRAGATLAADQASLGAGAGKLDSGDFRPSTTFSVSSLFEGPQAYRVPSAPESKFLTRDFRPRGASIADADSRLNPADGDLVHDNTVWQRLAEYRTHDRVRVLTLWESGASTVSLQAGRKGDPSLQWTSRLMNRGGATHGLLDRLFPVSVFGEHSAARVTQHPANAQPTGKPAASLGALRIGPP
jgi:hypothetical protein